MKRWGWLVGVLVLWSCCGMADFLPGTEDIPLMPGMQLSETDDFSFDSPMGQVLTVTATTDQTAKEIYQFYDSALISLGWERRSAGAYVRGRDSLKLTFPAAGKVQFDITLSGG